MISLFYLRLSALVNRMNLLIVSAGQLSAAGKRNVGCSGEQPLD